jgi:hypothetical protein
MRIPVLMSAAGATLCLASAIHFGLPIALGVMTIKDSFPGAATPELILGILMLGGAVVAMSGQRVVAIACTGVTLLLTLYGATVTAGSARWGDLVYHAALLTSLAAIMLLLVRGEARRVPLAE